MRPDIDREEALLRAKKLVYDEELELVNLRKQVANAEATLEYRRTGPKREPIADDVKLVVWARMEVPAALWID